MLSHRYRNRIETLLAGGFRAGGNQLWQIVFSKDGVTGGYSAANIR
jgi:hypothetical protein